MEETSTPDCFGEAPAAFQGAGDTFFAIQTRGSFEGNFFNTIGRYTAAYAQDNWKLNDYLTIKLGLRWEQERLIGTQGTAYTYSNSWGPRLGVILDPFGTRKTKISFNFARFFQKLPNDLTVRAFSGERSYLNLHYWVDPSRTIIPDQAHYVGLEDCGSGSLGYICLPGGGRDPAFSQPTFSGTDGVPPLPGTRMTYQDEFGVGVQHEVKDTGIVIGARYIDRRIKRLTEDTNAVSIEDAAGGLFNIPFIIINPSANADQFINPRAVAIGSEPCFSGTEDVVGAGGTGFCFSADSGDPGSDGLPDGLPDAIREYQAVEITFERRMQGNWQFFANWRIARLRGNFEGAFRNDNGQADPGITSLFDFTDSPGIGDTYASGALPNDRTHIINSYGSYMFNEGPANGLNLGIGIRVSSGKPISELLAHPLFANAGEIVCNSTVLGTLDIAGDAVFSPATQLNGCESSGRGGFAKTDTFGTVDFHVDYPVRISERFSLKGGVDVFNTFNGLRPRDRREFKEVSAGTPDLDFDTPTRFQRPFNMRFSLRLEW
jgi:outer membrane receptor protein involved in Fe transport